MSRRSTSRSLLATLLIFVAGIITVGFLYVQFFTLSHPINDNSMSPTLPEGTTAIINSRTYINQSPKRGEIVLVQKSPTIQTLARIIGLPNETITITDKVYINEVELKESYATGRLAPTQPISLDGQAYLLMTDDRLSATPLVLTKDKLVGPALWYTGGRLPFAAVQHHLHK